MSVTGWKTPNTTVSVDRDGKEFWANPDNAQASDDTWAICALDKEDYGDWLRCTNFGFSAGDIPAGSTIDGIEVKIERQAQFSGEVTDNALYLRKTAGQVGDNKASAVTWGTSDAEAIHGNPTDTWNASLVDTDVVSSDFGIDLSAYSTNIIVTNEARVDCVWIRVYYTETAAGGIGNKSANMGAKMIAGKLI